MSYEILYTQRAKTDIVNIYRYVAIILKAPEAAQKIVFKNNRTNSKP